MIRVRDALAMVALAGPLGIAAGAIAQIGAGYLAGRQPEAAAPRITSAGTVAVPAVPQSDAVFLELEVVGQVAGRPPAGPMPAADCEAIRLAVEAAAVGSVREVRCRRPRFFTTCTAPEDPFRGYACPVWTDSPSVGPPPDQK
jgi:hypothetical protein